MKRRDLTRLDGIKSEVEKQKNKSNSFFELLDLLDFSNDLRYK